VSISIAIVAHPKRRAWAHRLSVATGGMIIPDDLGLGAKANHLHAWEYLDNAGSLLPKQGDWGVVLEDDVVLCEDFERNLERMLDKAPSTVVSLYLGRGRPPQYQRRISSVIANDVSFITADALFSGQGYALPIGYFSAPIIDQLWGIDLPIDEAITQWVRGWHGSVSYPKFSLIEHRDGPTLIDDHGDGQPRNGPTALCDSDCDPSGARLPEIRKAWLLAGHNTPWDLGSIPLPEGATTS